jgi:hypothetical protein
MIYDFPTHFQWKENPPSKSWNRKITITCRKSKNLLQHETKQLENFQYRKFNRATQKLCNSNNKEWKNWFSFYSISRANGRHGKINIDYIELEQVTLLVYMQNRKIIFCSISLSLFFRNYLFQLKFMGKTIIGSKNKLLRPTTFM